LSRLNPLRDIAKGQTSKTEEPDARSARPAAKPDGESEYEDWVDAEGEAIRAELAAPVKGRTTLPPFKAHHDYVGHIKSPGLAGQIERLCYDVNSMVDTLGLNAKAVTSFVKGHTEHAKPTGRQRDDLEDDSDWCLVEISELGRLEDETMDRLEDGRIQNVREKFDTLKNSRHDIAKREYSGSSSRAPSSAS
jgi:nucleoporin NUP159